MNRYAAFISYRHVAPDRQVAAQLHRSLETYRVPAALRKKGIPGKIGRVFRDREELEAGELEERIQRALEDSQFLIVVCSTGTPESRWVSQEISFFQQLDRKDHILPVLIDGTPEQSFPSSILTDTLASDMRPLRSWRKQLRTEKLRLLARILGCSFDELRRRDRIRAHRRNMLVVAFAAILFAVLGLDQLRLQIAKRSLQDQRRQVDQKQRELQRFHNERLATLFDFADSTIQSVQAAHQRPDPSAQNAAAELERSLQKLIDKVRKNEISVEDDLRIRNAKATLANYKREYREALAWLSENDEASSETVLETRATALLGLRQWPDALKRYQKLSQDPDSPFAKVAVGICLANLQQLQGAAQVFSELLETQDTPDKNIPVILHSLGMVQLRQGAANVAIEKFRMLVNFYEQRVKQGRVESEDDLALSRLSLAWAMAVTGDSQEALRLLDLAITAYEKWRALDPDSVVGRFELAHQVRGIVYRTQGELVSARKDLEVAVKGYKNLVAAGHDELSNGLAASFDSRGSTRAQQGKVQEGIADVSRAINIRERIVKVHPELEGDLAASRHNLGVLRAQMGDHDEAQKNLTLAIGIFNRLGRSGRPEFQRNLARSYAARGASLAAAGREFEAFHEFVKACETCRQLPAMFRQQELNRILPEAKDVFFEVEKNIWKWSTHPDAEQRDGPRAKSFAEKLCDSYPTPWTFVALAAACAEVGEFAEAVEYQKKALQISDESHKSGFRRMLEMYEAGRPYRDPDFILLP